MADASATDQMEGTDTPAESAPSAPSAVERLIERFGGLRPMADKLGVPVSTVQGWKKRALIPGARMPELRSAAARHGIALEESDLEGAFRFDERAEAERAEADRADTDRSGTEPVATEPAAAPTAEPETTIVNAGAAPPTDIAPTAIAPTLETPASEPAAAAPVPPAAAASAPAAAALADSPSPVAALAHAYMHPASPAVPPRQGGGRGIAVLAVLLAVAGTGLSLTQSLWSPDALRRTIQVGTLEGRVNDLETRLGTSAAAGASLADRVAALETRLQAIDGKLAATPPVAAVLALRDLRTALAAGRPFAAELDLVRAAGLTDGELASALAAILPYAERGVPSATTVSDRFTLMVPMVAGSEIASLASGVGRTVLEWLYAVGGAVSEQVANLSGDAVAAPSAPAPAAEVVAAAAVTEGTATLIGNASAALDGGDLGAAIGLVSQLQGDAATAAAPWLADARARLAADAADAALAKQAAALLR